MAMVTFWEDQIDLLRVQVMVQVPAETAVTRPLLLTEATPLLSELQLAEYLSYPLGF